MIILVFGLPVIGKGEEKKTSPVTVRITGATEALEENIRALLPSMRGLQCDSSQQRLTRFMDAADAKLTEAAEALGYFNAQFQMTAERKQRCWVLIIKVTPGSAVTIEKINFQLQGAGKDLPEFKELQQQLPYRVGDVFVSQAYEDFKTRLKRTANRLGFFDAQLKQHTIRVNPDTRKASVELAFDTGKRYTLGNIAVQQDVLDSKHIQAYIRLQQGDVFHSDAIIKQQRLLESSGYYKTVLVSADYQAAARQVIPVTITAVRRKRYTYKGAIGMATNDGVYLQAGMETHWINRRGHQLDLNTRLSSKYSALGFNYKLPLSQPESQYLSFSGGWSQSDNNDIRGTALKLGLNYHWRSKKSWEQIASISYLDEKTVVGDGSQLSSQLTLLGLTTQKTQRNDALFPTQGWRLQAGLKGALEGVLSDQTLLQVSAGGKYLHTFDNQGKIILQGKAGTTLSGDLNEMPKSLRFFAGGQKSVRGYSFESLGEQNAQGDVIGGKHLLTLGAEYEHPVKDKISAAIFVDAGNAFNRWDDYRLAVGYGIGVRYKSPLGPIRVDFAVPEDNPGDVQFYFSLGPDL